MRAFKKTSRHDFLSGGFDLPRVEEKVLEFWKTNHIFEKSLAKRKGQKTFVFYEGPPYANGKPGIHHVLARVIKDIILRYKSMRGYYVPRKAGWDTHGLPVEIAAEKALGLKSKREIEKFGIKLFNQKAKEAVWLYKDEWEQMTRRIGYWLDLENAYVTYTADYIETIWWTLKRLWEKKLLYRGHKVVPWCTRCGTALSSHELAQGYKKVTDKSVYVKFKVKPGQKIGNWTAGKKTYILSWTTTPWTLPGNVALAVGKNIEYVITEKDGDELIYASARDLGLGHVGKSMKGSALMGVKYEPLFNVPSLQNNKSHHVYAADFVITTDGTGVVHTAVMYGEDDYQLGKKVGLPQHHTVTEEGRFTKDVPGLAGLYVKAKETEEKIVNHLEKNKNLLKTDPHIHEYPFCWRCGTPVLYYARTSWFIAMSKLRKQLLASNKKINWIPAHVKEGRFGEWLREVKDWNLSRERYWGAPLPIWECAKCGHDEVVGGLDELNEKSGGARNRYFSIRHGESENKTKHILDSGERRLHLTTIGRDQVREATEHLKKRLAQEKKKIDFIISSDVLRCKETAEIAAGTLGIKKIRFDKRLREIHLGTIEECHERTYHELFPTYESRFATRPERGESVRDLRARVWNFLQDTEKKYQKKNILVVSHEYPIWALFHAAKGWTEKQAIEEKKKRDPDDFVDLAGVSELELKVVPRDDTGEVDLHRPYTDTLAIPCPRCRAKMLRVKEVADVWYDSGAMPFAQGHWPFARNQKLEIRNQKPPKEYPADYIAEGMDQTRGWFYTLLAVATALGYDAPYKNVISLGLINDKHGQKMSKSKGNVVDPWAMIQKYGVDAVRWYFYSATPPGEPKNFDEQEVAKAFRRFHLIIYNSLVFFETYRAKGTSSSGVASRNILDRWITSRLYDAVLRVTRDLERYEIRGAAFELERLVDDLSRWYIRRSRRRFQKPVSGADHAAASRTLHYVLRELAKLIAPFTPFFGEMIYERLGSGESVHLENWPLDSVRGEHAIDKKLIASMDEIRRHASDILAKRAEAGVKVRQPLAAATVKGKKPTDKALVEILEDEANVKRIVFDPRAKESVVLDTRITPELKEEGLLREFTRIVQGLRQEAKLQPKDAVSVMMEAPEFAGTLERHLAVFKKEIGAKQVEFKRSQKFDVELETQVDSAKIWVGIRRIKK